ncbi:MAG: ThuA domain-containing protein [Opitutaceae bacterium]
MKPRFLSSLAITLALSASAILAADAPKKIVFIAGPLDHGRPPAHQYLAALEGIQYAFDTSPSLKGITTKLYKGQIPADLHELDDAAVIVIESSGDKVQGETHAIFPLHVTPDQKNYPPDVVARLEQFDRLMKKGVGLVVLHYAINVRHPIARKYFLDWVGGFHETDYSKTQLYSSWEIGVPNPNHPIARGVTPWKIGAEEFNLIQRLPEDPRRTLLFTAMSQNATAPNAAGAKPDAMAWAVQREGGGRGFVYTGLHFHAYLSDPNNRTAILNGIAWAAGIEIPAGGIVGKMPEGFPTSVPAPPARGGPPGAAPAPPAPAAK